MGVFISLDHPFFVWISMEQDQSWFSIPRGLPGSLQIAIVKCTSHSNRNAGIWSHLRFLRWFDMDYQYFSHTSWIVLHRYRNSLWLLDWTTMYFLRRSTANRRSVAFCWIVATVPCSRLLICWCIGILVWSAPLLFFSMLLVFSCIYVKSQILRQYCFSQSAIFRS